MKYIRPEPAGMSCSCVRSAPAPCAPAAECASLPVIAFVPVQSWDCAYTCGKALVRGTLFPSLDKPFAGKGGCCNG